MVSLLRHASAKISLQERNRLNSMEGSFGSVTSILIKTHQPSTVLLKVFRKEILEVMRQPHFTSHSHGMQRLARSASHGAHRVERTAWNASLGTHVKSRQLFTRRPRGKLPSLPPRLSSLQYGIVRYSFMSASKLIEHAGELHSSQHRAR